MILDILKDIWFVFGRLFPWPVRPGLRVIGNPDRNSPVLVTSNFEMTVRRVIKTLKKEGIDAYLLVAPTKGINVWCASEGGHFTTDTVVSLIKTSGIERLVEHRELILPQLSASGINKWALKQRTGWNARFGPVDIRDLAIFLQNNGKIDDDMRRVKFPPASRLVMGTNLAFNTLLFLILPFMLVSVWVEGFWWKSSLLVLILSVFNSLFVFQLPGAPGLQKGMSLGVVVSAIFVILSLTLWSLGPWQSAGWAGWILALSAYLGYDLPGWTPLWRADTKELLTGKRRTQITFSQQRCSGCSLCAMLCPVGVFSFDADSKKAYLQREQACQACGACIENCPAQAIKGNFRQGQCSCPTCTVINSVNSSRLVVINQKIKNPHTNPATKGPDCYN
jgi:NAD-dependent dihydropyrimidine dehydrogenase PreA subunit